MTLIFDNNSFSDSVSSIIIGNQAINLYEGPEASVGAYTQCNSPYVLLFEPENWFSDGQTDGWKVMNRSPLSYLHWS